MVRIGTHFFSTHEEADEWVKQGNIGGCYTIITLTWCVHCHEWRDTYRTEANDVLCLVCDMLPKDEKSPDADALKKRAEDWKKLNQWNQWVSSSYNANRRRPNAVR